MRAKWKVVPRRSVEDTKAELVALMGDWRTAAQLAARLDMSPTHISKMLLELLAAGAVERKAETEADVRLRLYTAREEARRARVPVAKVQGPPRPVMTYRAVPMPGAA